MSEQHPFAPQGIIRQDWDKLLHRWNLKTTPAPDAALAGFLAGVITGAKVMREAGDLSDLERDRLLAKLVDGAKELVQ